MPEKVSKSLDYLKKCQNFYFLTQTNPFLKIKQHFRRFEKLLFLGKISKIRKNQQFVKSSKMLFNLKKWVCLGEKIKILTFFEVFG